jgi:hypothetical protein
MTETTGADWRDYWSELRSRRVAVAIAAVVFPFLWIVLGSPGLLIGFLGLLAAYHHLRAWLCPRCFMPIVGAGFTTFTERCRSCDLEIFSHAIYVRTAPTSLNPEAFALGRRTRRFIAGYEILAGASLMVLSAFSRAPWWLLVTLEGLAGLSLAAGVFLWRDDLRGYALTRTLQIVQLIRVQSPWLTYVATSGIAVDLSHANGAIQLSPGFNATFSFLLMPGQTFGVAVNLWAAALLLAMTFARPCSQVVTRVVAAPEPAPVANEVSP